MERLKNSCRDCIRIIIGDVPVLPHGFGPSLYAKTGIAFYKALADAVHQKGCKLCAQLHQSDSDLKGMVKYIPRVLARRIGREELRALMNQQTGPYITNLSGEEVAQITDAFGKAAELALEAGFDMVQVHGDRMCGSFSSALFNRRTDCYGGSPQNRARFAVEAVSAIRRRLPDVPIDYKLAVRQENPHYGNAGVLESELPVFVPLLERAGVTSFHVALANHGSLTDTIPPQNHPEFGGEGCFLKFCSQVRALTSLPICAVGGLTDPEFVEAQLLLGRIDCAAMSRQLIADPSWPNKVFSCRAGEIQHCIRCNKACLGGIMAHRGVHCIYERSNKE